MSTIRTYISYTSLAFCWWDHHFGGEWSPLCLLNPIKIHLIPLHGNYILLHKPNEIPLNSCKSLKTSYKFHGGKKTKNSKIHCKFHRKIRVGGIPRPTAPDKVTGRSRTRRYDPVGSKWWCNWVTPKWGIHAHPMYKWVLEIQLRSSCTKWCDLPSSDNWVN